MNQVSEYWYMFSTFARSVMQKKSTLPCSLTGLYRLRVSSISICVWSAIYRKHKQTSRQRAAAVC